MSALGSRDGAELGAAGCQMQVAGYGSKLGEGVCAERSLFGRLSISSGEASVGRNFFSCVQRKVDVRVYWQTEVMQ